MSDASVRFYWGSAGGMPLSVFVRTIGHLLAANGQAIAFIFAADWFTNYLDGEYPIAQGWGRIIWPIVVLSIAYTYFVILRNMIRSESRRTRKP